MNMFSESQIAIYKKVFLEEMGSGPVAKKALDIVIEKTKTPAFALFVGASGQQQAKNACEELGIPFELAVVLSEYMANNPITTLEERYRKLFRISKDYLNIDNNSLVPPSLPLIEEMKH